jgi:glucuronate isomerase
VPLPSLLDPDRLFPSDPASREIARELYASVAALPILSPHGHVDAAVLLDDEPFADAADLLVRHDHYVTRLLHAAGIELSALGLPDADAPGAVAPAREIWRTFSGNWRLFAGTASGYWLNDQLVRILGVDEYPSAENSDAVFDRIAARLAAPEFRPRALFDSFGIEVLATTDDPLDDLSAHAALAADATFRGRVLPTFRPDAYLDPADAGWAERIEALTLGRTSYVAYLDSLAARRQYFIQHGAVAADHGVVQPLTIDLSPSDAQALFDRGMAGTLDGAEARAFSAHMLLEMARMSVEDGLVMTVHAGVHRNHSSETHRRFGPDTGHDLPVATNWVESLHPLLERFGNRADFHLVLFGVDETAYSREIAPMAGFYPSVYVGAPWWFLDAPDAVLRFRAAVTETAGFYRGSGFVDDTRAFLSIPARHDMSRRLEAAFLARLVREGRVDVASAASILHDLVDTLPRRVFKL